MDDGVRGTATPTKTATMGALRGEFPPRAVRAIHLGLGAFHRAHQAWFAELAYRAGHEWGIAAFTGRRPDEAARLEQQSALYHLLVRSKDGDRTELISSLSTVHDGHDTSAWLAAFKRRGLRLVTITITEAGYRRADGGLDWEDPEILGDAAAAAQHSSRFATAPFRLALGLAARRSAGLGGVALVSCDNLHRNGHALRGVVLAAAELIDTTLSAWIAAEVDFPNSMVDRITPKEAPGDIAVVRELTGTDDAAPVVTEPFAEWVLEESRHLDALGLSDAGVRFVPDIAPYERRKLLMLNGGHSLLAYAGRRRGHETVAEAVADPVLRGWLEAWWDEASLALDLPPRMLSQYRAVTLERFENPAIRHTLSQISTGGSHKVPIRTAPVLRAARAQAIMPDAAARLVGAWAASRLASGAGAGTDPVVIARDALIAIAPELAADGPLVERIAHHIREQGHPMTARTIQLAEVVVTSPDRNFVTLRITTSDGLVGLGDATLNGRELSVVSYLADHVVPLLLGRDADRIEDAWQFLYRSGYWRRGPVTMAAIAAVDVALWDIKAQAAGVPLYQLLGGASRDGLLAYGHASGATTEALFDSIHAHLEAGYRAIRVQTGVPGLEAVYGVVAAVPDAGTRRYDYEPAGRGASPRAEDWDTRAYLRHVPTVFEAVRAEFGPELPLLHDGHHRMTPIQAAKLGKSLEPYDLFWLEDATPGENPKGLRLIRQHTTTPIAIGEVFNTIWDYQTLITEQLIDYVRSAVTHTGGITHLRRILDFAAQYQIKSGMHGPTDISPVGMAAAMHLGLAIHNFGIQEYMRHGTRTDEVFQQSFTFSDGLLHPGDNPGLGVTLDVDEAGKYPYQQAYLPYNRLLDGTVHDW